MRTSPGLRIRPIALQGLAGTITAAAFSFKCESQLPLTDAGTGKSDCAGLGALVALGRDGKISGQL